MVVPNIAPSIDSSAPDMYRNENTMMTMPISL